MVTIHNIEQNTEEWFKLREGLYTASEAARILKEGLFTKTENTFKGNKYTQRGHDLEPIALELYHKIKNSQGIDHGFVTNSRYPKSGASPDDLTVDKYIEVKCFGERRHRECSESVFFEVLAQVQYGLMITEYEKADLVLFNPDVEAKNALVIIEIKADKIIHDNFRRILNGSS